MIKNNHININVNINSKCAKKFAHLNDNDFTEL